MAQEYFINDQTLENKVRQLLPSQGGRGAGFDLSASTQIIPIVDLTESAEGSNVRQDLQTAFSFANTNTFSINDASNVTIINNTGYYLLQGVGNVYTSTTANTSITLRFSDSATTKIFFNTASAPTASETSLKIPFSFVVFLEAGISVLGSASADNFLIGAYRQIATIDGILV